MRKTPARQTAVKKTSARDTAVRKTVVRQTAMGLGLALFEMIYI